MILMVVCNIATCSRYEAILDYKSMSRAVMEEGISLDSAHASGEHEK